MISAATTKLFDYGDDETAFRSYLAIKYRVFVEELGWSALADDQKAAMARVDAFDTISNFALLSDDSGFPIGIVRATSLVRGFPYRELFKHHLSQPEFAEMFDYICSINALAVLPEYRRRVYRDREHGWIGSAGQLLLLGIIRRMEQAGMDAAILTTGGIAAARLCRHLGFLAIDHPTVSPLRSEPLLNMALVFGSDAHIRIQHECLMTPKLAVHQREGSASLSRYFETCQRSAIGQGSPDDLYVLQDAQRNA